MMIKAKRKQLSTKFEHQANHNFMKYGKCGLDLVEGLAYGF